MFCGLGGWSDGLALEGFDVTGVEIEPKIAALYKHRVIVADVGDLNPEDFRGYDLIVGSPPCRNFSSLADNFGSTWRIPPDPEGEGMRLVNAFINFVEIAKPKYWLMENVPGLQRYYCPAKVETYIGRRMKRCFWGNFPKFLIPRDYKKPLLDHAMRAKHNSLTSAERGRIPLPVARALGAAIRQALEEKR